MRFFLLMLTACLLTGLNAILPPFLQHKNIWAEQMLKSMTLQEKIGQLFVVAAVSDFEQPNEILASSLMASPYIMDEEHVATLIEKYHVGGVIFLYKSTPQKQLALTATFQKLSKIPLLIVQDAEWGLSMRLDKDPSTVVRYPRNMTLGALADEKLMYSYGYEVGQQCAALGVHLNCAPVVDVNCNRNNPVIHDRSFGDDPHHVAQYGELFARGLHDARVLACAKHCPGHGDTFIDSHLALPTIDHDRERLDAVELVSFKKLIHEGVASIMMGHLSVPALDETCQPASVSHTIVTDFLKHELGFEGLVITDGLGMKALTNYYQPGDLELAAFLAGNDILLCPLDVPGAIARIEEAIRTRVVSEQDLDERVLKILQAKAWVFEKQKQFHETRVESVEDFLVRPDARALQETLYRNALTFVKKDETMQFGPELLNNACLISFGSSSPATLLEKLKEHGATFLNYPLACDADIINEIMEKTQSVPDVIITLASLTRNVDQNFGIPSELRNLIAALKSAGKRVHSIVFGTPYSVPLLDNGDTLLVAYEETEAAQDAVGDVLLGAYQPTGKLPVNPY